MKKVYEKPRIYMEKFELSSHIAACKVDVQQANKESCYATGSIEGSSDSVIIFTGSVQDCFVVEDENFCYYVHDDNSVLLNS